MQAILDRASLNTALTLVKRAVNRKQRIPVLTSTRIQSCPNGAVLIGTDLDREIRVMVDGAADADFDIALPAHMLGDMVRKSKAGMVSIDAAGDAASLDFEGVRARVQGFSAVNFPEFPALAEVASTANACQFVVMSDVLADAFGRTAFAVSTEETRYYLNGVYLHVRAGELRAVATDGHRLAWWSGSLPDGVSPALSALVPAATVADVLSFIGKRKPPVPVTVVVSGMFIEFRTDRVTIRSKLIDGTFPDYQRVTPADASLGRRVSFDVAELSARLAALATISKERGRPVKLAITECGVIASIFDVDSQTSASDRIPCRVMHGFEGGEFCIGFNARYLLDALAVVAGPSVELAMSDQASPIKLRTPGDAGLVVVQMPMRV